MHYLITGGTGFIGTALIESLRSEAHEVTVLTRQSLGDTAGRRYVTDLDQVPDSAAIDACINLAGASLAGARWSARYKQEIIASRLDTTRAVVQLCKRLERKPEALLSASAIGYYGHHGDEKLGEDGATAGGFSHTLCKQWEDAAAGAKEAGLRVCLLRLGVVLDREGGAFQEMARPFRLGVANWMGSGQQWLSWVHREDVIRAIRFLLEHRELSGPFNVTAPQPVTSRDFCHVMKKYYRTLITAPVPAPAMRLLAGEMADELLLKGQRVVPAALESAGFSFSLPALDSAVAAIRSK